MYDRASAQLSQNWKEDRGGLHATRQNRLMKADRWRDTLEEPQAGAQKGGAHALTRRVRALCGGRDRSEAGAAAKHTKARGMRLEGASTGRGRQEARDGGVAAAQPSHAKGLQQKVGPTKRGWGTAGSRGGMHNWKDRPPSTRKSKVRHVEKVRRTDMVLVYSP